MVHTKIKVGEYFSRNTSTEDKKLELKRIFTELYINDNISINKLSKELNINRKKLTDKFKELNIKTRKPGEAGALAVQKNFYNIDIFRTVNEDSAYIIGLIMADGHLVKNERKIKIVLKCEDGYILEKISTIIMKDNKVKIIPSKNKDWSDMASLVLYSSELKKTLMNIGIPDICKSQNAKFIDFNDDTLTFAFIRGYFDGNGSIRLYKRGEYLKYKFSIVSASEQFLISLKEFLIEKNINIQNKAIYPKKGEGCYSFEISSLKNILKLKKMLYKDAGLFLIRKYKIFQLFDDIVQ